MTFLRLLTFLLLSHSLVAHAVLGEAISNKNEIATRGQYRVQEQAKSKLQVREFSSGTNKKVFAVAWKGKNHPSLKTLLGTHYPDFQKALVQARTSRRGHSPIQIDSGDLHVEMGGNSRAVYGRVWIRSQLPQGMDINAIH